MSHSWRIIRQEKHKQDEETDWNFEEHLPRTLWKLNKKNQSKSCRSTAIISLELAEAAHKNQYPFLSLCWSQTLLTMVWIKMWSFFFLSFSFPQLLKSWGHPLSVPSVWLHDTNYYSLLRKLLASGGCVFCSYLVLPRARIVASERY